MSCLLIAECCQNHNGKKEILKKMIHEAAENGADYVKIQAIRSKDLSYRKRFESGLADSAGKTLVIKRPYKEEFERLSKLDLSLDQENWFVEECKKAGVMSMTTAFTRTSIAELKNTGYDAIKIASYDCASIPLLEDVKNNWKKVFISTGATYNKEISSAAKVMRGFDYELLHCVTIYPTPLKKLNLNRINFLKKFNDKVGYSDHSKPEETDLWASKIAIAMGASNLERHFTVLQPNESKDGPVSINPNMLYELKTFSSMQKDEQWSIIKNEFPDWELALGSEDRELTHEELLNRDYYRGRFCNKTKNKNYYNWEK